MTATAVARDTCCCDVACRSRVASIGKQFSYLAIPRGSLRLTRSAPEATARYLGSEETVFSLCQASMREEGQSQARPYCTAENAADMFTKVLDNATFHRHRATVMSLAAKV